MREFGPPTTMTMKSFSSKTCWLHTGGFSRCRCSSIHVWKLNAVSDFIVVSGQDLRARAMHFSSIAIGVGSRLTSTVVRQGPVSALKYSA